MLRIISNLKSLSLSTTINRLKSITTSNYLLTKSFLRESSFNPLLWNQDYVDNSYYFAQDYTEEV